MGCDLFYTCNSITLGGTESRGEVKRCLANRSSGQSKIGMEDAMLHKSTNTFGTFKTLDKSRLLRDPDYPIRVTYQFYKTTDTDQLEENWND